MLKVSKLAVGRCVAQSVLLKKCGRYFSTAAAEVATSSEQSSTAQTAPRHTIKKERYSPMNIHQAIDLIKEVSWANFDETVEISLNMGLDPRKPNQSVKGVAALPYGLGKVVRVCVFATGNDAKEALEAGAEVVGADELVASIQAGNLNFDTVIATPEMMSTIGKLGRVSKASCIIMI